MPTMMSEGNHGEGADKVRIHTAACSKAKVRGAANAYDLERCSGIG
jgi:hypothetical protein